MGRILRRVEYNLMIFCSCSVGQRRVVLRIVFEGIDFDFKVSVLTFERNLDDGARTKGSRGMSTTHYRLSL